MLKFEIEFAVYCSCGNELTKNSETGEESIYYNKKSPIVTVPPCEECINKAIEEEKENEEYKCLDLKKKLEKACLFNGINEH